MRLLTTASAPSDRVHGRGDLGLATLRGSCTSRFSSGGRRGAKPGLLDRPQPRPALACLVHGVGTSMDAQETDRELRIRAAFEEHYAALFRLAYLLCGSREVAEDLVQDAFVRVGDKLDEVARDNLGSYLRRIVINGWRNRLRRLALERQVAHLRSRGVVDPVAIYDDRHVIWQAVLRLPARQRACLVLRFYEGLTEHETAEILGCSVGAVKGRTHRGLLTLRKELDSAYRRSAD